RRYGQAGRDAATRVLRGQMPSALFQFPLSEDVIEAARVVLVHSEHSRAQVLGWCPHARVLRVPMGVPLPPEIPRERARRLLALPEDQFVVASVTFINPYKRLDVVMQAVRRLREFLPARLVLAGGVSHLVPLERLVGMFGLEQAADVLGYVDDCTARLVVAAADVCVNLRWPTAGETSASLLRTMGAGRPVLVTDAGSFAEYPDGAVIKVPPDVLEEETIFALLRALAEQPALRDRVGRLARAFVAREHSLAAMARGYAAAISEVIGRPVPVPPVGQEVERIDLPMADPPPVRDPLAAGVAQALVDLGIAGDAGLVESVARAAAGIGLAPGKMDSASMPPSGGKDVGNGGE
ncbi:MAG: glycosyltransferase family 4 protein, partial [Sphaerobacter sp.]|nr:glycosyltransferase family 4 protein [Sphaerobacter sp.]